MMPASSETVSLRQETAARPRARVSPRVREGLWAALFLAPSLLALGLFNVWPTLQSFYLSLCEWNLLGSPRFVGLANYQALFADSFFYRVLAQTGVFVGASVALEVLLALGLALLLYLPLRGLAFFRTAIFLPVVTSLVAVAILWGWLYDPQIGALNWMLGRFGLGPVPWLLEPGWAMASVVLLSVWKGVGTNVILFLAGLSGVPPHYDEAARVDGATALQRFFHVTLPLLAPTVFLVLCVSLINAFQAFDAIYTLTAGGPQKGTTVLVYWLYQQAFSFHHVGKASAIAYVLFALILAVTALQWWARKRWVHAES